MLPFKYPVATFGILETFVISVLQALHELQKGERITCSMLINIDGLNTGIPRQGDIPVMDDPEFVLGKVTQSWISLNIDEK